ncbi:RNA polymerase sigma factor [Luteolibacter sp. Populi]|uniref:RNA polymerase sigma factor n=1 Tax=Luteolibacter sp. Populi TaxID=3230487 RepID=UPI003466BC4F
MNDHDLIRDFTATRSEQAFRRLVDRHCDLVYSVASRVTRDADLARDVSQQVFCKLAAKPATVPASVPLAAWLHRTTRSCAVDLVRSEQARRKREEAHFTSPAMTPDPPPDWSRLEPVIDSLIDELPELERRAVVLRFYEKKSHGAIGNALGLSEEAARKRLDRAMEKLRGLLAKRGIVTTAAALATILPAHATVPAPAGLSASLSSTALSTAAITAAQTTSIIAIIMSHKAIVAGAALLLLAGVTAVAVPRLTRDNDPPPPSAAGPGLAATSGDAAEGDVESNRGKSKGGAATARLAKKYGDSRAKLSAHLSNELIGLGEDALSVMDLIHGLNLGEEMAEEPSEIFGEAAEAMALTEEQQKKIKVFHAESFKRESEEAREQLVVMKKEPAKLMELLLVRDSLKRGETSQADYDAISADLGLPDEDIFLDMASESEGDSLDDKIFLEQVLSVLDAGQAKVLQDSLAARSGAAEPETKGKIGTLEEFEQQISSARKMVGGALQMMEGMTGSGLMPGKNKK